MARVRSGAAPGGGVRRAGEQRCTLVQRLPGDGWPAGRRLGSAQARVSGSAGTCWSGSSATATTAR